MRTLWERCGVVFGGYRIFGKKKAEKMPTKPKAEQPPRKYDLTESVEYLIRLTEMHEASIGPDSLTDSLDIDADAICEITAACLHRFHNTAEHGEDSMLPSLCDSGVGRLTNILLSIGYELGVRSTLSTKKVQ